MSQEPTPKKQKTGGFFPEETPREKKIKEVLDQTLLQNVESIKNTCAGYALKQDIVEYEKDAPVVRGAWFGGSGV